MQSRAQKEKQVVEVTERIKDAKALVFANFKGVNVQDLDGIRKELKTSGSTWQVLKKTLLSIALKNAGLDINARELAGQVGVAFSSDEVAAAKVLAGYLKNNPESTLAIEGGALGTKKLSAAEVKALAKIPGTQELRGMFVGTLAAPLASFVRTLAGTAGSFVRVLGAIRDQKQA